MAPPRPLRLDGAIYKGAAVEAALPDIEAPRSIGDAESLIALAKFAGGLATWASQFITASPATLLAANMTGVHGINACMQFIGDTLVRIAPFIDGGRLRRPEREPDEGALSIGRTYSAPQQRLTETLNCFRFLQDHIAGHLRHEPDIAYPNEQDANTVPWVESWQPADDETAAIIRARFRELNEPTEATRRRADIQRTHDRIAILGRQTLCEFQSQMTDERLSEGFPHMRAVVAAARPGRRRAKAKGSLRKFETLTQRLFDLFPEPLPDDRQPFGQPHQEFFAANLIDKFVVAGHAYLKDCLPLLNLERHRLQGKRKGVLRRFAVVAQYGFLASSNGRQFRYLELLDAVGTYAYHLRRDAEALLDRPSIERIDGSQEAEVVSQLNKLVIEPQVLENKLEVLGKDAPRLGAIIAAIVADDPLQEKPWTRGDRVHGLSKAGVIGKKANKKRSKTAAVTTDLIRLQQVGLAVQVPLDYLLAEQGVLPKRRTRGGSLFAHDGLPWIVNPLGAMLTQHAAVKPKRSRGASRRATNTKEVTAGRITAKKTAEKTAKKSRTSAKPMHPKVSPKRALPKAAKKWPRA